MFKELLAAPAVVLLLGAFVPASVHAAIVVTDVELAGPGPYYTVDITVPGFATEDAYDDALVLTINGKQWLVNCDDLTHNISTGGGQSLSFEPGFVASNFNGGNYSQPQIDSMAWLLDKSVSAWKAGGPSETMDLAAYQLASWQVGNPTATFVSSDATVQSLANEFEADSIGKTGTIEQLSSTAGVQAQISAVPEPATWSMLLFGVGLVGSGLRAAARSRHGAALAAS